MKTKLSKTWHPVASGMLNLATATLIFVSAAVVFSLQPGRAAAQSGGDWDLSWNAIGSGGQRSVGGDFVLDGVIGQPGAAELAGGAFTLQGGFLTFSDEARTASRFWTLYD